MSTIHLASMKTSSSGSHMYFSLEGFETRKTGYKKKTSPLFFGAFDCIIRVGKKISVASLTAKDS